MARITYVKKAQQRFATIPVLDPATGQQKRIPVMGRDGKQKQSKRGPVFRSVSRADHSKPLPNHTCDKCGTEILVGQPYKHVTPKSGPYGGYTRFRCGPCPTWQVWELSSALWARVAQIEDAFQTDLDTVEDPDSVSAALSAAADEVRNLAEEKRESASNIEDGFGHPTYQSEELEQTADELESWADELEGMDVPGVEDYQCSECDGEGEVECEFCDGSGEVAKFEGGDEPCGECTGGRTECEECEGEEGYFDLEAWREAVQSDIVFECPVG